MKISTRTAREDVTIVDLDGKLVIGEGDVRLREKISELLDSGVKKLLINMQQVNRMDSSGLGELVRTKDTAAAHEATIKLLHVEDKVQEVLEMTHLIGVFETFDDETEALASFH